MAVNVKCPVCRREGDRACITLIVAPDRQIRWVSRAPHEQRLERSCG